MCIEVQYTLYHLSYKSWCSVCRYKVRFPLAYQCNLSQDDHGACVLHGFIE